jgi:hypothetical protein
VPTPPDDAAAAQLALHICHPDTPAAVGSAFTRRGARYHLQARLGQVGLGRIIALCCRSSASYQIR